MYKYIYIYLLGHVPKRTSIEKNGVSWSLFGWTISTFRPPGWTVKPPRCPKCRRLEPPGWDFPFVWNGKHLKCMRFGFGWSRKHSHMELYSTSMIIIIIMLLLLLLLLLLLVLLFFVFLELSLLFLIFCCICMSCPKRLGMRAVRPNQQTCSLECMGRLNLKLHNSCRASNERQVVCSCTHSATYLSIYLGFEVGNGWNAWK